MWAHVCDVVWGLSTIGIACGVTFCGQCKCRRGDCVVVFGRKALFETKRQIETATGLNVGVIYGSLPPATRKDQARKFNEGEYVVLGITKPSTMVVGCHVHAHSCHVSTHVAQDGCLGCHRCCGHGSQPEHPPRCLLGPVQI